MPIRRAAWRSACALALAAPAAAFAQQDQGLILRAGISTAWEDNLFRVPDSNTDPQLASRGIAGRGDRLTTAYLGIRFDKPLARQRFVFDLTETTTTHQKFKYLDREVSAARGDWHWQLTPLLSGTLSADRSESPVPFDETRDLERNTLVTKGASLNVIASIGAGWALLGGLRHAERTYSRPLASQPNSKQDGVETGIRYTATSQSTFGFLLRNQEGVASSPAAGAPITFGTGAFTLKEAEATLSWIVTAKSTVNSRLTRVERRHALAPARDFSGNAGELVHRWTPTVRLSLDTSVARALSPFVIDTQASYRVDDTLSLSPVLLLTDKVRLSARAARVTTNYLGPVAPLAMEPRRDELQTFTFTAEWTARRTIVVTLGVGREKRASNRPDFEYQGNQLRAGVALSL